MTLDKENRTGTDSSDNIRTTEELEQEISQLKKALDEKNETISDLEEQLYELAALLEKTSNDHLSLIDACTYINSTLDIGKLKLLIMELAANTCNAESSSIMLIDETTDEFYFDSIVGDKSDKVKQVRFPKDMGIAGWVATHRDPLLISNVAEDPRFYKKVDEKTEFETRSILCVPLISKENLIGVVEVVNKKEGDFTDSDLQHLMALANQAAITIDNARLYHDLTQEKRKIETIVNSMADGVIVTDSDYNVTLMNPAAKDIFLIDKQGAAEEKIRILLDELEEIGDDSVVDIVLMRPEKLVLSNRTTLMRDSDSKLSGAILAMRNVTEMRRRERLKSEFLTVVAHRLNEPMEDMMECWNKPKGESTEDDLKKIQSLADRIKKLVVNLINFSELEAGPMRLGRRSIKLTEIVQDCIEEYRKSPAHSDGVITFDPPADLSEIRIDVDRIEQVMESLFSNAFEMCKDDKTVNVSIVDYDDNQKVTITYKGEPMPSELADELHDHCKYVESFMFGTLPGHDQGLGLAFIRHIIDAHGGKIDITANGDENSFSFTLVKSI